jgi:hypothetical protein
MSQHRLLDRHGEVEARLRRMTGGTSHRRPPRHARNLATVALAGVVAGGALASTVDLTSGDGPPRPGSDGGPGPGTPATPDDVENPERDVAAVPETAVPETAVPETSGAVDPVVTPTPALAVPKTTAPAAPLWFGDGPDAFRTTPWNTVGTAPPRMDDDALRFAVSGPYQRSELEPAVAPLEEGDELYFAFSVRLDESFPANGSSRQVITQWKNDSPGSAPVDLRVWNGQLVLHGGHGHPSGPSTFTRSLGPAPVGRWSDVVVRVRFSANPDEGSVSAWQDGEQEVGCYHPPGGTLYPGQTSYLKTGLAREPTITRPAEVAFRDWTVGPTLGSVR